MTDLSTKWQADVTATNQVVTNYLSQGLQNTEEILGKETEVRKQFLTDLSDLDKTISDTLLKLEELRDAKNGIVYTKVELGEGSGHDVLIRDARNTKSESLVAGTESYEIQYLSTVRAALDIAKIYGRDNEIYGRDNVTKIQQAVGLEAVKFFENFRKGIGTPINEEAVGKHSLEGIARLALTLRNNGIKENNLEEKLFTAREYQTFKDKQANIVTISTVQVGEKQCTVIEKEIALRGITAEQQKEYEAIANNTQPQPGWFTRMQPLERALLQAGAAENIAKGNHVIPTQLKSLLGARNLSERRVSVLDAGKQEKELLSSVHVGALAWNTGNEDIDKTTASMNIKQVIEFADGKDVLYPTFLSTNHPTNNVDRQIIALVDEEAGKFEKFSHDNIPLNLGRHLPLSGRDYTNSLARLQEIAKCPNVPESVKKFLAGTNKFLDKSPFKQCLKNIKSLS